MCTNQADSGFWKDVKDKYLCTEVLFEAKNKDDLGHDDLRQTYCYLKRATGLLGILVTRNDPSATIVAYNRTLFQNFEQSRAVLILSDRDLLQMVEMKLRGHNPADRLREQLSSFMRSV